MRRRGFVGMVWIWTAFIGVVTVFIVLDLVVLNRRPHAIKFREAAGWTSMWVSIALSFTVLVYFMFERGWMGMGRVTGEDGVVTTALAGRQAAIEYLTAYIVELSLSLDNLFVIAMIFAHFRVEAKYQHRVLFWGILGAIVMRGVFIVLGMALLGMIWWVVYIFGGLLLVSAVRMLMLKDDDMDLESKWVVRVARRFLPISSAYDGQRFVTMVDGVKMFTPLLLVLLMVETADLVFAVDSIPAVFAVVLSREPFLVFTSNIFAILGLRSMYFMLAGAMGKFKYIKTSLVFVLGYVGVKMILSPHYHIDPVVSLVVIVSTIGIGVLASVVAEARGGKAGSGGGGGKGE